MKKTMDEAPTSMRGTRSTSYTLPSQRQGWRAPLPASATGILIVLLTIALFGCGPLGYLAHGVAGGKKRVKVTAEYRGLEQQRIAVLVAADEYTLHQHRQSPLLICRAVSVEIAEHVDGAKLVTPRDAMAFQQNNPYWATDRYSEILEALDVDRLVVIDLMDYRLNEPGNAHVWQGLASATVLVAAREAVDPDQPVLSTSVRGEFPEASKVGTVGTDAQAVQTGLIEEFSVNVGRLFYDHEVWQ